MTARDIKPMDEIGLKHVLKTEIEQASGYIGGEISEERRNALEFYEGEPLGNEIPGRSSFVSTDVQDVVESIMPDLVEIFTANEGLGEFEARQPDDVPSAKQATEYVNWIWNVDNDGFNNTHDWIKDALIQKNGVLKIYWDESERETRETKTKVNHMVLAELEGDPTIEILEAEEVQPETPEEQKFADGAPLYDVTVIKHFPNGRIDISVIPPEEFLISRRAEDIDRAEMVCHKVQKTVSDLLKMGFSKEEIDKLPSEDEQDYNEERISRFNSDDEWPETEDKPDPAMREIWLYDTYLKVDYDGDGIAELRNVIAAGSGYTILQNEAIDDHPFVDITPIRMPHKFFGRSIYDLIKDLQKIKSTIVRQVLDNMYLINNARTAVNQRVSLDDYLDARPGGVVRVDGTGSVGDAIMPLQTSSLGNYAYPLLEHMDSVRELRTGITRYNQGVDANSLNRTATGINMILDQSQKRKLLIARVLSEMGFKRAFKKILRLVINNQNVPQLIKLRNEYVHMDPRTWNADMNFMPRVGLGHATRESKMQSLMQVLTLQEKIVNYQGGVQGPLVNLDNIYESARQLINLSGHRPAKLFIDDPSGKPPPPPKPDPEAEKMKAEMKLKQQELSLKQQEMQAKLDIDRQETQARLELKKAEMEMEDDRKRAEIKLDHARNLDELTLKIEEQKIGLGIKDRESRIKTGLEEMQAVPEEGLIESMSSASRAQQESTELLANAVQAMAQATQQIAAAAEMISAPKRVIRENGRVVGMETVVN